MGRKANEAPAEVAAETLAEELVAIEVLFERHKVPAWQQAGLRLRMGWAGGKLVGEGEFLTALEAWLHGPVC